MNTFGSHSNGCALLMSHSRWTRLGEVCPNKGNLLSVTYNNYTAFSPHSNIFHGLSYTWNDAYPCGQKTTWNMNWNVNGGEKPLYVASQVKVQVVLRSLYIFSSQGEGRGATGAGLTFPASLRALPKTPRTRRRSSRWLFSRHKGKGCSKKSHFTR